MKAYIKAINYALPDGVLTNEQVASLFPEWTVEKIEKKLGIKQRHITAENETASDIAMKAADKLFETSGIDKHEIDYLIFVSQSPDYHLPTTACVIHMAQVTKYFRTCSIYVGAENMTNFRQDSPIIGYDDPYGTDFDASMVWGPTMGWKAYIGFRYDLEKKD